MLFDSFLKPCQGLLLLYQLLLQLSHHLHELILFPSIHLGDLLTKVYKLCSMLVPVYYDYYEGVLVLFKFLLEQWQQFGRSLHVFLVKFLAIIRFLFNLLDNNNIGRITERNTITRYTTFIMGNTHGGENPTKTSLI
jgi:hypothetical protein